MRPACSGGGRGPQQDSRQAHNETTPDKEDMAHTSSQRSAACHTPQECATMLEAMEQAMQHAQEATPDSHPARDSKANSLQEWLKSSGLQLPTPAARDLQALVEAAADNRRLRKQLEALREAELELAAREAEETAMNFSMLEEENLDLASQNAQLQQRISELEALAEAAEVAAQAQQQQRESESPEPSTPQHQRMPMLGLCGEDASMQERATSVLKRAAAASRLSGMCQEEHQAKLRELSEAEGQLSAMKSQAPGSTQSQQTAMQQRLTAAEQQVQEAAEAAQAATAKLQAVLQEKEEVQGELSALRQQLEAQPNAAQHAELYAMLLEAQQQLRQEKQQHQQLAGSLLEHAGRLSHKYYNLSDDYDALEHRYQQLARANEHLAGQLKEAHEALYDVQTAVQATPVHKRHQQQHLMTRLRGAEEAVMSLAEEKQQLQERLLQAHTFISCLQQRSRAPAPAAVPTPGSQQHGEAALTPTPGNGAAASAALTPLFAGAQARTAAAAEDSGSKGAVLVLPAPAAAAAAEPAVPIDRQDGGSTLVLQALVASQLGAHVGTRMAGGGLLPHAWPQEPVSPILAAAARSRTAGEQRRQKHRSAASHELQEVQQEQLGLRQEISRAKSALADIAGQLRASIGSNAAALSKAAGSANNSATLRGGVLPAATAPGESDRSTVSNRAPGSVSVGQGGAGGPTASAVRRPERQAGPSTSSSSSSERSRGTHNSKAESAGQSHGPGRLQELHKAAAAVRSASAARSGCSSRSGSQSAATSVPALLQARSSAAAAPQQAGSDGHWDQLSRSTGDSSHSSGAKPAASAPAVAGAPAMQLPASMSGSGAASHGTIGSHIKGAACLSAPAAAASGSAGGSLSLDQLIADAESVSLEYGMSPGRGAADTAASAGAAAAAATHTPAGGQASCGGPAPARGNSCSSSAATPEQQGQAQFAFVAGQPGLTPGSAASSAGAGAHRGLPKWSGQSPVPQWELTPASLAGPAAQPADMQSCMRGAPSAGALGSAWQQATPAVAATPAGLERVASNTALDALGAADPPSAQQQPQQSAHEQPLLPADATPTNLGGLRAAVSGAGGGHSSVQQRDQTADLAARLAAMGGMADDNATVAQSSAASVSPASSGVGASAVAGSATAQQQEKGAEDVTPVKGPSARPSPDGAGVASPPSALKKAAAALLSSISPAGLVRTPDAAAGPSAAAAADAFAGGLSPQLLQHLTPEWLRSLKRKCKQESEQLQQLRRQMGLATPETLPTAQEQQQQQGSAGKATPPAAAAAGEAAGTPSAPGSAALQAQATAGGVCGAGRGAGGCTAHTPAASTGDCGGNSTTPLTMQAQADTAVAAAAAGIASHGSASCRSVPAASHSSASLGQLSSRGSIDRLRRRAIMAQATAAATGDGSLDAAGAAEAAAPSKVLDLEAAAAAAKVAAWVSADAAASQEEPLDRSSSAGSLAEYMRHNSLRSGDLSAPVSRTGSITPSMLLTRPECPTPGSMYSDLGDGLASTEEALSAGGSVSPDMLLAGLRSSRIAARHLQQQLMQQLEKTSSTPSVLSQQHEAALVAVLGSGGLPRTSSAAAAVAAAARTPAAATELSEASDGCDSPALQASTQLVAVHAGAPDATPGDSAAQQYGSPVPGCSAVPARAATAADQQVLHQQLGRLLWEESAAGSPATPGAALNAGAESRLLSPGTELQLVFDDKKDSAAADSAADSQLLADSLQHWQQCKTSSCSSRGVRASQQPAISGPESGSPQASESSSCVLPLGVAAKAQPAADAAVAAPSPPASVMTVTPGVSAAYSQGAITAQQPSSLSTGTAAASAVPQAEQEVSALSALVPPQSAQAAAGPYSAAHSDLRPAVSKPPAGANSSSSSIMRSTPGSSQAAGQAGVVLDSPAGAAANTGAGAGCISAASTPRGPASSSVSKAPSAAGSGVSASSAAARPPASVQSSAPEPQQQAPLSSLPIVLGDSPSSKPQRQEGAQEAGAVSRAWAPGAAAAATPGCASAASDSCMSSSSGPQPLLGTSPGSAEAAGTALAAAAAAQGATPTSAGAAALAAGDGGQAAAAAAGGRLEAGASATAAQGASPAAAAAAAAGAAPASAGVIPAATPAVQPTSAASGAAVASAAAGAPASLQRSHRATPEAEAAASAAIAAAFAMPKLNLALHPRPLPPIGAPAAAAAAVPAASSTSWGSGSCMFATPAAAFNSPGGTYGGGASDSSGQQYYTGRQGSSNSSRGPMGTTAATNKHRAAEEAACSPAYCADAAGPDPVAFAGFRVLAVPDQAAGDAPASPVMGYVPVAAAAAVAAAGVSGTAPVVTATAQKRILEELLGSPGDSDCSGAPDSPAPLPAAAGAVQMSTADDDAGMASAAAAAAGSASPPHNSTGMAGDQQVLSPTLSELGFVAASASADVAATKQLQRQQQEQGQQEQEGGRGKAADLAGLSFEQRLELLCAEDGSSSSSSSDEAGDSPQPLQLPAHTAAAAAAAGDGSGGGESQLGSTGMQRDGMACCATQTTPVANQGALKFKEAGVQVPTPTHPAPHAHKAEAAGLASTAVGAARPCDVSASPIKGRDQAGGST